MVKKSSRVDVLVGQNVRAHRMSIGMSQEELGRRLGITFQQVQKYEKGVNRVGSGRLYQIATIFEIPVSAFFEGAETVKLTRPAKSANTAADATTPLSLISEPQAFRLLQAFSRLEDLGLKRSVVSLVEQMADATPDT